MTIWWMVVRNEYRSGASIGAPYRVYYFIDMIGSGYLGIGVSLGFGLSIFHYNILFHCVFLRYDQYKVVVFCDSWYKWHNRLNFFLNRFFTLRTFLPSTLFYSVFVLTLFTLCFQLVGAVATPIAVPNKTVSISLGFQLNFVEPWNASEFHMPHKNRTKRDVDSVMYSPIQAFLGEYGFDGETCLLRSICEAALHPFKHKESGLLEEIAHAVLM